MSVHLNEMLQRSLEVFHKAADASSQVSCRLLELVIVIVLKADCNLWSRKSKHFHNGICKMPTFMMVYRGGHVGLDHASPEQMQHVMQTWMDWIQKGVEAGWMLDGGDGLRPGGAVVNADLSVTDGPFAQSRELVGGYSMVEAPDLVAAVELAKGSPMPTSGGTVEVRELANVGQQG
ncbi:MAG: YciI family protein [Planctomycetota bacterium]|nr:YciI family protein [Planctomycetota bacterium]